MTDYHFLGRAGGVTRNKRILRGLCSYCPRKKNRKTKKNCLCCGSPACNEHTVFICMPCSFDLKLQGEDKL